MHFMDFLQTFEQTFFLMRTSKEKPCCSALKIALYKKKIPSPIKMTLETLRQRKKAELFFQCKKKRQNILSSKQEEDNFLKINEMPKTTVLNGTFA